MRCRHAETTAARRATKCERERRRPSCETVEQTAARRATDRSRSNRHRSVETPQTEARRSADHCCSRRRRSCAHHFGQLSCRFIVARYPYDHFSSLIVPYQTLFTARARNARIASAVLATAIPSVRLSVRHTPVLCQNDFT